MARKYRTKLPPPLEKWPAEFRTMAEVYRAAAWRPEVTTKKMGTLLWSLEALASVHRAHSKEEPLDSLARPPCRMIDLRGYLARPPRLIASYTDGTWRNVRRGVFAALRVCGIAVRGRSQGLPVPVPWHPLTKNLLKYPKTVIIPFARYCGARGITPNDVEVATFAAYRSYLLEQDTGAKPEATYAMNRPGFAGGSNS